MKHEWIYVSKQHRICKNCGQFEEWQYSAVGKWDNMLGRHSFKEWLEDATKEALREHLRELETKDDLKSAKKWVKKFEATRKKQHET